MTAKDDRWTEESKDSRRRIDFVMCEKKALLAVPSSLAPSRRLQCGRCGQRLPT